MNKLIIMLLCLQMGITAWTQNRFEFSHPQMGTVFRLVFYSNQEIGRAHV